MKVRPGRRPTQEHRPRSSTRKHYYSARWHWLRLEILMRDRYLCRICESKGITQIGNQIDHILPADEHPDLFWNPENLQVLCHKCHGEKTRKGE